MPPFIYYLLGLKFLQWTKWTHEQEDKLFKQTGQAGGGFDANVAVVKEASRAIYQEAFKPAVDALREGAKSWWEWRNLVEYRWIEVPEHPRYKLYRTTASLLIGSIFVVTPICIHFNTPETCGAWCTSAFVAALVLSFKSLKYKGGPERVPFWKGTNERANDWVPPDREAQEQRDKDIRVGFYAVLIGIGTTLFFLSALAYHFRW